MNSVPLLACGSMDIGPAAIAVIFAVVGGWLICCALAVANLCLITLVEMAGWLKALHFGLFSVYLVSAFGLFSGWFGTGSGMAIPIVAIPVLVASHFALLLWARKRTRLKSIVKGT